MNVHQRLVDTRATARYLAVRSDVYFGWWEESQFQTRAAAHQKRQPGWSAVNVCACRRRRLRDSGSAWEETRPPPGPAFRSWGRPTLGRGFFRSDSGSSMAAPTSCTSRPFMGSATPSFPTDRGRSLDRELELGVMGSARLGSTRIGRTALTPRIESK